MLGSEKENEGEKDPS